MKISVILFNLGGPDCLKNVRPFLYNLFNDPAIIPLPSIFRIPLAFLISTLRLKKAKGIYKRMGGSSPLLHFTKLQANALEEKLQKIYSNDDIQVRISMRYFSPRSSTIIQELKINKPDRVILLPLYPQYSTTTTESSFNEFKSLLKKENNLKHLPVLEIKSYQTHPIFIKAHVELIENELKKIENKEDVVILFSAHGIPEDLVKKGDPYQEHVEQSVDAIMKSFNGINFELCYQSKVGPKKWLGPNTESCVEHYAKEHKILLVVPIAFVSDHSETLVELDEDYRNLAKECGAQEYIRVPSFNDYHTYINCLSDLVQKKL